jgi:hypothetical protein
MYCTGRAFRIHQVGEADTLVPIQAESKRVRGGETCIGCIRLVSRL